MTNDIPSIDHSDLIFIIGSDTSAAHPIIGSHIKRAVTTGKARLVVADPKRIEMADHASLYLAHRPGTDVMLLNGLMQQIIQNNWHDQAYIAARVEGFEALQAEVLSPTYAPDKVALVTGVPAEQVIELARLIGTAERTAIYYSTTCGPSPTCNCCAATSASKGVASTRCGANPTCRVPVTWGPCQTACPAIRRWPTPKYMPASPPPGSSQTYRAHRA